MSEMVERVARAIALAHDSSDDPPDRPLLWWGDHARAAIAAMREPTEKMAWSGASTLDHPSVFMGGPSQQNRRNATRVFNHMIDAALKEDRNA